MVRNLSLFFVLVALFISGTASGQVLRVDASATGSGNGLTWADAITDLQVALATPAVSEIWVAAGVYRRGLAGDQQATFQLRDGVAIYGGFAGIETERQGRDPELNVCILSADLDDNDTLSGGRWWQAGWIFNAGNSEHVVTADSLGPSARIDGFLIERGRGTVSIAQGGAGCSAWMPALTSSTVAFVIAPSAMEPRCTSRAAVRSLSDVRSPMPIVLKAWPPASP